MFVGATALATAPQPISGTWTYTQSNFPNPGSLELLCSDKSTYCWGLVTLGADKYNIAGVRKGTSIKFTLFLPPSTEGYYTGTINADGQSMSGNTTSNHGDTATWTARR
jgi:hypothetical protein